MEAVGKDLESRTVMFSLMCAGGMLGAYTYVVRGGVFCNAQSANLVLMGIQLGQNHLSKAAYYLIPLCAYLTGSMCSEWRMRKADDHACQGAWQIRLIELEALCFFGIGLLPLPGLDQPVQILINFLASMQYNSFRKVHGVPVATTFATNHVRQTGIWLVDCLMKKDPASRQRLLLHVQMLGCFAGGSALVAALSLYIGQFSIWLTLLPLFVALYRLKRGNLSKSAAVS